MVHLSMILVTGGTGLVGAHLLFTLCKEETAVKATFRNENKIALVKKVFSYYSNQVDQLFEKIQWVKTDILDLPTLEQAFNDVHQVYHTAALVSFDPKEGKKMLTVNIEGTTNIVNLCIANAVEKLCFVSSIAALGQSVQGKPITEENEWTRETTTYGASKHFAEMEVWRASQEGIPIVVVNPGIIIAPGLWKSSSGSFFYQAAKGPKYHLPGGTGFVSVKDVTAVMTQLMKSEISNERFILVSQNWTYNYFARLLAQGLKQPIPEKEIKFWMLGIFWRWDWMRSHLFGKRRRLSKAVARLFETHDSYDGSKIEKTLDFRYGNLENYVEECCTIYLKEQT